MNDTPTIRLGFTRGVAPSKWAERWRRASPEIELELVPLTTPYGRKGRSGRDLTETCDVIIERTAPGETPEVGDDPRTHHTMRLYEEAVALVVAKDSELAEQDEIHQDDLALVKILGYPQHSPEWPPAEPWDDPAWMPADTLAALELVATGLGAILAPLPLARHLSDKRKHAVLRVVAPAAENPRSPLPGTTVWATWSVDRDGADVQQLAGVLRGRTARSSRSGGAPSGAAEAQRDRTAKQQQPAKKKPKLKPNSRGAQLAAVREKAERAKAAKRAAKRGKRR